MVSQPKFLVYGLNLTILTLNKVFETRPMHQDVLFRHFQNSACAVIFLALCNLHRDFGIMESWPNGSSDLANFFCTVLESYKLLIYGVSAKSWLQKSIPIWEHPQNPRLAILIIMVYMCRPTLWQTISPKLIKLLIQTQKFQILQCCAKLISKVVKNDLKILHPWN